MEVFLIRLLQFLLAISLLVFLHECGHMFFARLFGVRVEKFFMFFDIRIGKWDGSLFKFKPKKSDTEYGIGWLPLGGYCKIAGMIDESFDTEQMKQPEQPWEFRSRPAWQRLLIMIGGVLVNFLLALFIYSMVLYHWGEDYVQVKDMTMGMKFNQEAKDLGFRDGDILLGTNERAFKDFSADLYRDLSTATRVDLIRNGKKMSLSLPGDLNLLSMLKTTPQFVRPYVPANVDSVLPNSAAAKAGMQKGDRILAIAGKSVDSYNEFEVEIGRLSDQLTVAKTHEDSLKVRNTSVVFIHKSAAKADTASVLLSPELALGVAVPSFYAYYKPIHISYGFFESFPKGIKYGVNVLSGYVSDMQYVFTKDGVKSLGGFGAIGSLFPPTWDWHMFWLMTAFLSIILAFMNIIPIPALDGGHVLFLLIEMITRRKPSEKVMIWAEYIGMGFLLLLLIVANMNDVLRWIGVM